MNQAFPSIELAEVCTIKGGKRLPKGEELVEIITTHPYIRARDIGDGKINFTAPVYITDQAYEKISRYIVSEGDVIITIVGANIGDAAFVEKQFDGANLTENAVKLTARKGISPKFLKYALTPEYMKGYFQTVASGAAQGKLGLYKIKKVQIPLPTFPTQQKIARILSAYDDLIENNLKRIKLLEEMAQITYEEWFVRMKFPGHEQAVIDSETGLPEGWIRKVLNEGINVNPTTKVSKKDLAPFVPMGALSVNSMVISGVEERKPSGGAKFINGDTLVARITPCLENGKTGYVNFLSGGKIATGSTEFIVLRETRLVNKFYIYCMSRSEYFRELSIRSMAGSDGRQRVNPKIYGKMLLSIPTMDIMDSFEKRMNPIFNSIKTLVQQNQHLKEARDILLPRLMIGMIDVDTLEVPNLLANKNSHTDTASNREASLNAL